MRVYALHQCSRKVLAGLLFAGAGVIIVGCVSSPAAYPVELVAHSLVDSGLSLQNLAPIKKKRGLMLLNG